MAEKHEHRHARGRTKVQTSDVTTFDDLADGPALIEVRLTETFTGDIDGEGTVCAVQAERKDGSGTFAGIERVRGSIAGRTGTFVLQVIGTIIGKDMHADWFVVPGSGTGELKGLRGAGGFEAERGQQGSVWLEYSLD